jgi:GcrA cell cycle regulator
MIEAQATWTTERIALLKNRMDAGFSCGQIAQELGVSRNAVIGKANRLGLSRFRHAIAGADEITGTRTSARAKRRTQVTILRALSAKPQVGVAPVPIDSTNACRLYELQQWHCRWPIGDPGSQDFGFCGLKPLDGLPYCPRHARMAYRRRSQSCQG